MNGQAHVNWCDCDQCSFNDEGACTAESIEMSYTGHCSECDYLGD